MPLPLLLLIAAGLGYVVLSSRHPADDMAANAPPSSPPDEDVVPARMTPVMDSPPATVVVHDPVGRPASGPSLTEDELQQAIEMAQNAENDLEANGSNYNRVAMAAFQRKARLSVDGLYGGRTAGAIQFFLGDMQYRSFQPYPPIFAPLNIIPYKLP